MFLGRRLVPFDIGPIPFDNVLTILVSILLLLRDEKKGRESVGLWVLRYGRKGGGRLLIKTESVYRETVTKIWTVYCAQPTSAVRSVVARWRDN